MSLTTVNILTWCVIKTLVIISTISAQDPYFCRDSPQSNCANIKPHHCYDDRNRLLCCSTCRRWRRPSQLGCEYGDRSVIWRSELGKYTCASYITFFSSYNCHYNSEFRRDCCQSCAEALANES